MNLIYLSCYIALSCAAALFVFPHIGNIDIAAAQEAQTIAILLANTSMQAISEHRRIEIKFYDNEYRIEDNHHQLRNLIVKSGKSTYPNGTIICYPDGSIQAGTLALQSTRTQQLYALATEVTPLAPVKIHRYK